ncbi:uncharacterized protein TM35_000302070 [Trypanosoma theileri]|uniref:C2 domain-containing protein n=1 Tax=Trypanosoma theileri TaxID=67003 RepID=A0A1X0NN86_9TRYP|nr:uncharacterized protein TM35_000302070 [Trypanosoma theileri]ORC86167.1 hypothetical protein TM35_000302070 [Trypanosoma theileri]
MTQPLRLHVDVLRGRNYPQTEDDPCPCSTRVQLEPRDADGKNPLAPQFTTALQPDSNAPFYHDSVDFDIPPGHSTVTLAIALLETTRKVEPYVLLHGVLQVSLTTRGRQETVIPLTKHNPIDDPEAAQEEVMEATENDDPSPVLSLRYQVLRQKGNDDDDDVDVHADVALPSNVTLTGAKSLVPKESRYVWVNLTSDPRWLEAFRYALVHEWRDRQPLFLDMPADAGNGVSTDNSAREGDKTVAASKSNARPSVSSAIDIRSIGDVIIKRWCCLRSHEVLTRLRLCAEAFDRGEKSLYFTRERELSYRLQRKERIYLLKEMTQDILSKTKNTPFCDSIDHLWILFALGINYDPAGPRALTYDARKKIREAKFDENDKVILNSCILNFLIPSLTVEQCDMICAADENSAAEAAKVENSEREGKNEKNGGASTGATPKDAHIATGGGSLLPPQAEVEFAMSMLDIIGAMLDTLTETELVAAFKVFEPAVSKAYQRIKDGAKEEVNKVRKMVIPKQRQWKPYKPGEGIKFEHLDILGRRKKSFQRPEKK